MEPNETKTAVNEKPTVESSLTAYIKQDKEVVEAIQKLDAQRSSLFTQHIALQGAIEALTKVKPELIEATK